MEPSVVGPHQIQADGVRVHAVRDGNAAHERLVVRAGVEQSLRDHAGLEDRPGAVDVGQERIQRSHPLLQAAFDVNPLVRGDQPRDRVDAEALVAAGSAERRAARLHVVGDRT
jgi:hypothetical protein